MGSKWARKLLDVMIRIVFLEFVKFIICIMLSPPITEYHSLSDKELANYISFLEC